MILYTIKQAEDGRWSIGCMGYSLLSGLQLGAAIKLARETARSENAESGLETCVEMHAEGPPVRLAYYKKLDAICGTAFA